MEDFSIRAIVIGVSVFVTILTLSAIVLYFNTARQAADIVNQRADIASLYDRIENNSNFEEELTGVQVRSLINHYAYNEKVVIHLDLVDVSVLWLNDEWKNEIGLISEAELDIIEPIEKYRVSKLANSHLGNNIIIKIESAT